MNKSERIIEQEPKYKTQIIDKKWIKRMDECTNSGLLKWPRTIRKSQVLVLYNVINTGKRWHTPIVINIVRNSSKNDMHIIDGAHRLTALKKFYNHPKNELVAFRQTFAFYENLTEEEERIVYEMWSSGVKQTNQDWIVINQDDILLWEKIQKDKEFPVNVTLTSKKKSILLRDIFYVLSQHLSTQSKYYPQPPNFIDLWVINNKINDWIKVDVNYKLLRGFFIFFEKGFGEVGADNLWSKCANLFYTIFDIYLKNSFRLSDDEIIKAFRTIYGNKNIIEKGRTHSSVSQKVELRKQMVEAISRKLKKGLE